jgi:hypothetical protein
MLLVAVNVVLVGFLAASLLLDISGTWAGHPPQTTPLVGAGSSDQMAMGLAHIPTSNACVLCHVSGGSAGLKEVPTILHPIEGWRRCTACHTNPDLARAAPGHDGIAEEECLNCHKSGQDGPPITQPHSALHDQKCLDCHGGIAHLPESMATAAETDCVLCHKPTELPPPHYPHPADITVGCRECHQSPQVGGLPIDHALRVEGTCLLCHDIIWTGATPIVPLPLPTSSETPGSVPVT